jgi:ATP-dependent Clp protease, protease subunit
VTTRERAPLRLVRNAAGDEVEILLYDEIGFWGIRAIDFVRELKGITAAKLKVRINSPGGDVPDAVAIYNALRNYQGTVTTQIDALAASAASLIALAGKEVRMASNALLMIHDPWGITIGNATDHRKMADLLDKVSDSNLVKTYAAKTGGDEDQVRAWMAEETWFTADEAKDEGFVDVVDDANPAKASYDTERFHFRHAPAALAGGTKEPNIRDVERALREAGMSHSQAKVAARAALAAPGAERDARAKGEFLTLLRDATTQLTTTRT